ncbi:sugar ABC transporter substrate-binding protein [Leekyejoonella antrihumi]|nr:sugar ABC transporter substrate-binding protein [Leekyejoonella antrihumi]
MSNSMETRLTARRRSRRSGAFLVASAVATTMAVAACSSGSGSPSSGSSGSSGSPASQAGSGSGSAAAGVDLSYVNAQLTKYGKLPTFTAPGPSFDAKKLMAGKTIYSIGVNNSDQFVQVLQNGMKEVAKQVGVNFQVFSNSGSPAQWVRGMQTAVNQKASVIDLLAGIDPSQLHPQIAQAKAAGIPVVVSDAYDVAQKPDPSVAATADVPYAQAGRLMADWTVADTKGKADVLVIGSSDVVSSNFMVKAIQNEFSTRCSTCKVKTIDVTVANWASQTQSQVQAALNADPGINYILPVYDSQSQFIVPAITAAGKTGKVFIATYDGTPFVLKMMQDGNTVRMDVGENLDWVSKAVMDQDMRVAAGLKPVKDTKTPLYIFTKKNVDTAGTPPKNSTGYGTAYLAGYKKLWGLS